MLKLSIRNYNGTTTSILPSPYFTVTSVSGLTPPKANINVTSAAFMDGSIFNSAAAKDRNIVINFVVESPAEANRLKLYAAAPIKQPCTVNIQTGSRNVSILGYVETVEVNPFAQKETAQISIICPNPWFVGAAQTKNISSNSDSFENLGDIASGAEFTLTVGAAMNSLTLEDASYAFFEVDYAFQLNDIVTINTGRGLKSVILNRGTSYVNLINYVAAGSTWLQISGGLNRIDTSANVTGTVEFSPLFSGV